MKVDTIANFVRVFHQFGMRSEVSLQEVINNERPWNFENGLNALLFHPFHLSAQGRPNTDNVAMQKWASNGKTSEVCVILRRGMWIHNFAIACLNEHPFALHEPIITIQQCICEICASRRAQHRNMLIAAHTYVWIPIDSARCSTTRTSTHVSQERICVAAATKAMASDTLANSDYLIAYDLLGCAITVVDGPDNFLIAFAPTSEVPIHCTKHVLRRHDNISSFWNRAC
mmetsp:Transcript_46564/g.104366  ORF Transcript_46564/g.104366 Transcript_46564/m.104366 type:complete len:229 (-) Transcript_46564:317-1003(-)